MLANVVCYHFPYLFLTFWPFGHMHDRLSRFQAHVLYRPFAAAVVRSSEKLHNASIWWLPSWSTWVQD